MATKYWFKASNGSDNWAVASNWYNGSGGTGGTTTVPTAADDVIIDTNSGSGIITIAAAATCLSIDFTGFIGTLAGTSTLAFLGNIILSSSMTLTYSGTATLGNGTSYFTSNGKTVTFNITVNNVNAQLLLGDDLIMLSTNTLTLSSGLISGSISVGLFVSTGSAIRELTSYIYLTGIGTVWNVSGTNFGSPYEAYITNASSSAKTISHTPSTGSPNYTFRQSFYITGAGTGAYTLTGNFYNLFFGNTGGASFSFGNSNIASYFDLGVFYPTCNMVWNNGATTITWNAEDILTMSIGQNITITASPALSYTNATGYAGNINNPYNKSLTGAITVNGAGLNADNLRTTGTITVTSGTLSSTDVYCSSISSSNSNTRELAIYNILYLTGTGTLASVTTTTNLTVNIYDIYVTNSSATAKSLTLNSVFYPIGGVYLAGSGSGSITLAAGISAAYFIYVTNTGGAPISFSTATIKSLEFFTGTNAVWSNAASQTLTITDALSIASSAGNPTLTPSLLFIGNYNSYTVSVSLNGKSLVTGGCTLNDSSLGANQMGYLFDGFSSNAAFTVTSASYVEFSGPFSGPSYTYTSAYSTVFYSSLTLTGALSLANNALPNDMVVNGNFSAASISHLATGTITLAGTTNNVTTSITLNNATSLAFFTHYGTLTTTTVSITNGYFTSYGNVNCTTLTIGNGTVNFYNNIVTLTGIFTLTSGTLYCENSTFVSTTFVSTASGNNRDISLNNCSWTLIGTGTVWNVVNGGTIAGTTNTLDIYITNTSVTAITFAGGDLYYRALFIRRGAINTNQVTISGSNGFFGLYHTGGSTQTLTFIGGSTTYILDTFAVGSSSAVTTINSSSSTIFNIQKSYSGLVMCNNVSITRSSASPADTWYAINSTNVTTNTGWIFGAPSRRLGVSGAG